MSSRGGRWVDCPADYGPRKTIYNRFVRWVRRGIWEDIFPALAGAECEPDQLMIDSTIVKVHRFYGGAKGGREPMLLVAAKVPGQKKFHVVTNDKRRACVLVLTPRNTRDHKAARLCLEVMPAPAHFIADKGYVSAALRQWLVDRGTEPVIPPRKNRKVQYEYD